MRIRIALAAAAITLATHPTAAQSRGAQLTTGLSLASLGAYQPEVEVLGVQMDG